MRDGIFSTIVTDDKSHIPDAISAAPKYQDIGTCSLKNSMPYMAYFVSLFEIEV